ncbi:unnamed protein product [Phytophthora lilii]|uniref:Unnamed protein product n=1 Tax=Phytophthora lilii TaxID=2077276 RepID=A0A9W6U9E1_9STRA|nr:unnamed protein product [Phytophthora lilii]
MAKKPALTKNALQRAKELADNAILQEGDHWFALATPWWESFEKCNRAQDAQRVLNEPLIDKQLSSSARKVAVLKPKLDEGVDFIFVPENSWDAIARELDFDWEIRREVMYQRSQQELQVEAYPFAFKVSLVDEAGVDVVVLASRTHTLGQLLSEVWLAGPDDFRQKFPQLLNGINLASGSTEMESSQLRACYRVRRASDSNVVWMPVEKLMKHSRAAMSPKLTPRAKKRRAHENHEDSEDGDAEESDGEVDEHEQDRQRKFEEMIDVPLGDLRLDNRSEVETGSARLHELLIEQRPQGPGAIGWPSQGPELEWRMGLAKGDMLDALDTSNNWFEARVIAARRNKVHVHYRSWESKWDEWILRTSHQIAPPHSRVPRWRSKLREHSLVQVGIQVPNLRHPRWRNATVIEVVPCTDGQSQEDGDGAGLRVHVQVDNDTIWLPAHDDMLCQSNTHILSKPLARDERRSLANDDSLPSDSSEVAEDNQANGDEDGEQDEKPVKVDGDAEEGDDSDTANLMDREGSASPPQRASRVINAAVEVTAAARSQMDLRRRIGPARNLNLSFSQVQDQGISSAGRTPARRRSRSRVQSSSNETSPESPPPTPQTRTSGSIPILQGLWAQVGNDLQALQTSWSQLGEGLMAIAASQAPERSQDGEDE